MGGCAQNTDTGPSEKPPALGRDKDMIGNDSNYLSLVLASQNYLVREVLPDGHAACLASTLPYKDLQEYRCQ